ncbi:hypothetical protein DFJ43DRAFT_1162665 [Lentinula guzmanii]|uniref:Uncharacterized protein n=1 Tax=Lentinula guzmanii TaxID=2804957 RepID=A0AA38JID6_9AGAR|nr:hypothetical protein DFJ43DRAFT_1162665 [Lentinula guzmanii]
MLLVAQSLGELNGMGLLGGIPPESVGEDWARISHEAKEAVEEFRPNSMFTQAQNYGRQGNFACQMGVRDPRVVKNWAGSATPRGDKSWLPAKLVFINHKRRATIILPPVKAVQPERITIEVPEASDEVLSVGTVAVTQGCTRKGYTVLGSMMGLQRSFRQRSLHAIWVSLRSAKKKEVPERRTEPID